MNRMGTRTLMLALAAPLALGTLALPSAALAQQAAATHAGQRSEARDTLQEAQRVVRKMQADADLRQQMQRAQGLFVLPNFARAGLGVGVKGGEGVLLARTGTNQWSNPAFYNVGGITVGAQAGASAGQMAMLLMTKQAVDSFRQQNNFSLNANAGLSIIDWSARAQASAGKGDVVVWSDTEGLFAGATIGVSDIQFDEEENRAFYALSERRANPAAVLDSPPSTAPQAARQLRMTVASAANDSTTSRGTQPRAENDVVVGSNAPGAGMRAARTDRN